MNDQTKKLLEILIRFILIKFAVIYPPNKGYGTLLDTFLVLIQ